MLPLTDQCISHAASVLDALTALDALSGKMQVLFVVDDETHVVGSLTDGDIRRALVKGATLTSAVHEIMHTSFAALRTTEDDHTETIRSLRQRQIFIVPLLDAEGCLVKVYDLRHLHSILPIDAVLMAGGKGERLRPLTEKTPKPLLPVAGKAIIDYNVERLISFGVEHISITVNYLAEQLEEHFAQPIQGVQVRTVREPQFLGTMGSVQFVESFQHDTILVMNSDLFTDIDLEDFFLHFRHHEADLSVAAVPYTVSVPYGIMQLEGDHITGLLEKPRFNYYANAGIYLIRREVLQRLPRNTYYDATDLINDVVSAGRTVVRYPIGGTWIDIGNPQEYQKAQDLAAQRR